MKKKKKSKQTNFLRKLLTLAVSSSQSTIYSSHLSYLVSANHHAVDMTLVKVSRMQNQWAVLCLILTRESLQHSIGLRESVNSVVAMGLESTLHEFESQLYGLFRQPPGTLMTSLLFLESGSSHLELWYLFFRLKMLFSPLLPMLQVSAQMSPQRGLLCPPLHITGILPAVLISGSTARL